MNDLDHHAYTETVSSEDEAVTGTVAVTETDLTRGIIEASPVFRMRWLLIAIFSAIVAVYGATGSLMQSTYGVVYAVGMAAFFVYLLVAPRLRARKARAGLVRAAGDDRVVVCFDAGGVTVGGAGETAERDTFAYRDLVWFRENATTLVVSVKGAPLTIPKRAFAADDLPRARRWMAAQVKFERGPDGSVAGLMLGLALIVALLLAWQFLNKPAP